MKTVAIAPPCNTQLQIMQYQLQIMQQLNYKHPTLLHSSTPPFLITTSIHCSHNILHSFSQPPTSSIPSYTKNRALVSPGPKHKHDSKKLKWRLNPFLLSHFIPHTLDEYEPKKKVKIESTYKETKVSPGPKHKHDSKTLDNISLIYAQRNMDLVDIR